MKALQTRAVNSLALGVIAALAAGPSQMASAQVELNPSSSPHGTTSSTKLGAQEATTYFEFPIQKLKAVVPALSGIKYDDSQEQLPVILNHVAKQIADVLPRLPDLISREDVYHFQSAGDSDAAAGLAATQPWSRQYKYLLQCQHNADGSMSISESRIDRAGKPIQEAGGFTSLRGYGFGYQWLFLSAANQPESRFRYLGQQEKGGRKTFVLAFAQDPGTVTVPAYFQAEGKRAPFYYQGVLWVDQSSFDIVALRTDLLAPLPQALLKQLTTELTFRSVRIRGYDAVFWLPSEVDISSDQGHGPSEESHRYSDYHLFHAEARIVPSP
jgi:hypothetical protein